MQSAGAEMQSAGAEMQSAGAEAHRRPKVLVVGAGFAGLGAARRLIQGGLTDVTIVEAGQQPGGRVQTLALEGGFVELGAQFLHGESELFHFAQRQGLLQEEDEEEKVPDTLIVYEDYTFRLPGGTALKPRKVSHNLQVLEELMMRQTTARQDGVEGSSEVTVSVANFLQRLYPQYMARLAGDDRTKKAMIRWLESWHLMDSAAAVQKLSLPGVTRYVYEEGSGVQETKTGLWEIFHGLLQDTVPQPVLLLNKPVKSVLWKSEVGAEVPVTINNNAPESVLKPQRDRCSEDREPRSLPEDVNTAQQEIEAPDFAGTFQSDFKVAVKCEDGDILLADHVIVTPSVGFLKEHLDFFVPPLPSKHGEAINTMGFGDVAKVFLIWDLDQDEVSANSSRSQADRVKKWRRRMFRSDVEGMALLWPDDVPVDIKSSRCSLRTSDGRQWYEDICLIEFITSYDPCLLAWVGGEGAVIMESLPVSEVKEVLYDILVKFLGRADFSPPSRLVRSEWYNNPYTRGAYSYLATGVPLELQDVLSHPLPSVKDPVVQIAGEACSTKYYSTAHGALYSGQEAANTILRHHTMLP